MSKRKILIVHDDIVAAGELERRLGSLGYEVTAIASSGEEAISLKTRTAPDVLLVEMSLRIEMKRAESAEQTQTSGKPPAVFIVAETDEANLRWEPPSETAGFVVKPFTERELRGSIELALCRHDATKAVDALEDRCFT